MEPTKGCEKSFSNAFRVYSKPEYRRCLPQCECGYTDQDAGRRDQSENILRVLIISQVSQLDPLPTPADLPDAHVVIYDGKCVFCQQQVRNLQWWDGGDRLAFVSLHDPLVAQRYPDLTHEQMMEQVYVIPAEPAGRSDRRYGGAEAVAYLSTQFPRLWVFAPILNFPFAMPLWQFCYRLVANRRYKIAGKQGDACETEGTCDLHFKK